ncbi:bifunctional serine/threonine-protein kinase/formylglycine-generating enzyme family protein [Corallococcus silvisoli]|uniref:bifunctional serine/threonine-protein kinase/formylglycine-generating enzyme family protein n=1 Tax=Corallococcus silvisoli TaxID=2697031 RepID=UPI0022A6CFE6|nr:bifunctional serine/threonine-protein kinase/formylglycine-generating enzyme family protein [Corallococcus silvisoli]
MPGTSSAQPSSQNLDSIEAGSLVDGFRILRLLAEGAMGEVFLAQDLELGRRVALKFLKVELLGDDHAERLVEEARTTARFSHPNIITVHTVSRYRGRPYLALEYVEGESLRERLTRQRPGLDESLRICRAVAEAVTEAHRNGVIHADLKPENILIPRDGRVRVLDFGLARHAGGATGAASGTPAYMAPERWLATAPSPAMDVWSLGIIAWELLEGRRPLDDAQLAAFAFNPRPLPPSPSIQGLPGGALLEACLALEPERRPAAMEVARALAETLSPEPLRSTAERVPFRGLRSFTEADTEDYFGREAELDGFVERLRHEPLVPLVGPSGIGKSSFLHAGVFTRLRRMDRWTVLHARPGPRPLIRLAAALVTGLGGEPPVGILAESFSRKPGEVVRLLRRHRDVAGGPVLLALDAFEEVFTLASPLEVRQFAACLAAAAAVDDPWRIVLAMRDDYLGSFCQLEALRPFLGAAFVLGQLPPSALQEAITGPLRRVGHAVDSPSLISRLVEDVQAQTAGLPLLQFACMALWERRDVEARRLLTSVYVELGGVGGAIASHAQTLLHQLPSDDVRVARALLLRLVTAEGTRQPRSRAELLEDLGATAPDVLEKLQSNRLVVTTRDPQTDEPLVELAHESLAVVWPTLARWLEETREERLLAQQIETAAQLWEQRGRHDDETWSDESLRQTLHRGAQWQASLPVRSREFLETGRRRARNRSRRRRHLVGGFIALLAVVTVAAILAALAFREKQLEAIRQQDIIRLAAADIGVFDLVLEPMDFDASTQRWTKATLLMPLDWELTPAQADPRAETAQPYLPPDLRRSHLQREAGGSLHEHVEAPSRAAWLIVKRGDCPPSRVRLEHLPGYKERGRVPPRELRLPVPTCAASRMAMLVVPAGPYWRPADEDLGESEQRVGVPRFSMDRTEVTNGQFSLFEERIMPWTTNAHEPPPRHPAFARSLELASPVTGIDAFTAEAFCEYLGKSLPTADEWRKAFRGGLTLDETGRWPNPAPRRNTVWAVEKRNPPTNLLGRDPYPGIAPVDSFPEDSGPYGHRDLAGNVAEWTSTTSVQGDFRNLRLVLGGRWDAPVTEGHHQIAWSNHLPPRRFDFAIGLRCVERTEAASP